MSAEARSVHVGNISLSTTDAEIKDFLGFCGKVSDFSVTTGDESKTADVTFEKETAAKTALLLDKTKLGLKEISVVSSTGDTDDDGSHFPKGNTPVDDVTQEMKPRTRILAEYLAHGYVVSDAALKRAIDLDNRHGISVRFISTIQDLDAKSHATDRARAADESYGVTARAKNLFSGVSSYFEKASNTPTGKKIVTFYTNGSRQVQDVHIEAMRLANLKRQHRQATRR